VNSNPSSSLRGQSTAGRIRNRLIAFAVLALVVPGLTARAGNLTRSGASTSPGTAGASATQTTTQATTATSQSVQTSVMAQRAQFSLLRSTAALQAIQAAQNAARNLSLGSTASNNLGTATQPLVMVPDGLAVNGLVPGVKGTDAADPTTSATPVPVTVNANGTASVNLPGDTAVTLPPNATASSQVTVSGTGTVGSITTGGTITALKAGVATTVAPGSTISLTQAGTISFASASAIPLTLSTYTLPASWSGISGLTQSTYSASAGQTGTPTTVTVTQTQQQAILTWQSFNIGRNTTLDFDQSLGGANVADWIAINKIADNIAPSQILGSIQAPGQVYVINQNGIIFGGSSQVNAGALVAASLPINDNLVSRGLLNNPDLQFLFSQLNLPAGSQGPTAAFTPQGTASAPGSAPAPGSYGSNGGLISQVDASGNLSLVNASGQDGDIVVESGAQLSSPTTPEHVGGRVALIGPNVNNAGTISTPDGQTILAAGLEVGLAAHPSADPSLRGLDVSIGQISDPTYDSGATGVSGTATNDGLIEIPRADLTIAGANVNQNGVVDSSTSVSLNGRIDLLADYNAVPLVNGESAFNGATNFYPTASGLVTLGANSLTQILPELSSTEKVVGTQLALSSLVNIEGGSIHVGTDSLLLAPSANLPIGAGADVPLGIDAIALTAGVSLNAGNWLPQGSGGYGLTFTTGQVYLDTGSTIDVSGSENVSASVADNIIPVQLLGTELANSPLQQSGVLRGATVEIDIRQTGNYNGTEWVGSPIGDVSGYVNLIQHTVGELTTSGGTVAINAGSSTVMQAGSTVNVSGGWINYAGATVETTKVVSGGVIYDISQATPDRVYDGIYTGFTTTSAKWGVTQSYSNSIQTGPQYEAGYIQGANGGGLSILAPAVALDGSLFGNTVAGPYQRTPISQLTTTFAATTVAPTLLQILGTPNTSSLSLTFQGQDPSNPAFPPFSPTPPTIVFQNGPNGQAPAAPFGLDSSGNPIPLSADRANNVFLSPDLINLDGFGNFTIVASDGNITVPSTVSLTTPFAGSLLSGGTNLAGGSIAFTAANIDIEGNVIAPGGSLDFTAYDFSPYANPALTPPADPTRGNFTLGAPASLSTAGLVIDDRIGSANAGTLPLVTGGGSVTIDAFNVDLVASSRARMAINVSGGVEVSSAGKLIYGNGGSITIVAGQDPLISSILGGQLNWNPNLTEFLGYSGGTGGALSVKAPLIQIGGSTLLNGDTTTSGDTLWLNQTAADGALLEPDFFDQGGFTSFALNGIGEVVSNQYLPAVLIAPNTTIAPKAQSWLASLAPNSVLLAPTLLPEGLRKPVTLNFGASGVKDAFLGGLVVRGDFVMDTGASIVTDPQTNPKGGVKISGNTVAVLGSIIAPGGNISITGGSNSVPLFLDQQEALPTVDLGPKSLLSTAGAVNLVPNVNGYRSGTVLPGGTITVDGNIVAEAGAVLNVSGTSGLLTVLSEEGGGVTSGNLVKTGIPTPTWVDSSGGSITLKGEQELFADATLLGSAGGPSAQGGTLSVSSGLFLASGFQTPVDPTLIVTQNSLSIPLASYYPSGQTAIGNAVVDAGGNILAQNGYFAADRFNSGGFDSLTLAGTVQFSGPVSITANQSLTIGTAGVLFADSTVNLNAPYVDLGLPFQSPIPTQQVTSVFNAGGSAAYFAPAYGTGNINVAASLIDLGNLSLQNIGNLNLTAANGDIRGDGTLDVAGTISLTAGQIYPTTGNSFMIVDYDYNGLSGNGTVTIAGSGTRQLPYSAGGTLSIYASNIVQGGVLRAPLGTINLGSGVTGSTPIDEITGSGIPGQTGTAILPATESLTLTSGSVTSVSAVDPTTGRVLVLPYGTNQNGVEWDDPAGNNITLAGNGPDAIPLKAINISGANVADQAGAIIDINGGGDLYSYSFVTGTGGTNDILASSTSFAIIPGYQASYAPYYSATDYTNGTLAVGEQVFLNASNGLAAGVYTLLPARYALQPGAFLITPESGVPILNASAQANGTSVVSGYEFNGLDTAVTAQPLLSSFQVDPPAAVAARASYDVLSANTFLSQSATASGVSVPRLPMDAGQLVLAATTTLGIAGSVDSQPQAGGLGGLVDIASPSAILISGPNTDLITVPSSTLVLDSSGLSAFGADSLLIGGYRTSANGGDSVTVTTSSITVDNSGASTNVNGNTLEGLSAPDLILVSNQSLTLAPDAQIEQAPATSASPALTLFLQGDGTFLRVSHSSLAQTIRSGVNPQDTAPSMEIGAGATITGVNGGLAGSVTLDSTYATTFDPTAVLKATTVNLDSGQISLELTPPATTPTTAGLVLSGPALSTLQASAQNLSLLSYSSIDIYGSGTIGGPAVGGLYPVASLALHAGEIRGFSDSGGGGDVVINAENILLDNITNAVGPGAVASASGSLTINATTINLGANRIYADQYSSLVMNATTGIMLDAETKVTQADTTVVNGAGSLIASNNISLNTPLITAATFSSSQAAGNETITATGGDLTINPLGASAPTLTEGLGASLTLIGQNVTANNTIELSSGNVTLHATAGNVSVGGTLSVAGTTKNFNDVTGYTSGGQITISSDSGSVTAANGSTIDVSAPTGGGNAGSLSVNAPQGSFVFSGSTINGQAGTGGQGGQFSLTASTIAGGSVEPLDTVLNAGGFNQSITIRDRTDASVSVDGTVQAANYNLSVDQGSITVNGTINASNVAALDPNNKPILIGGTIDLTASGSIMLSPGSVLTVAGQNFDNAGKGGSVTLTAGAETNGNFNNVALGAGPMVNIQGASSVLPAAEIDLSVASNSAGSAASGDLTGTLVISAPQTAGNTDLQIAPINGTIVGASSIVIEGNQVFDASADGSIDNQEANVLSNGQTFAGNAAGILSRLFNSNANGATLQALTSVEPGAEIINPTGDLTLTNTWDLSTYRFGPNVIAGADGSGAPGILTLRAAGNLNFEFGASLNDGFDPSNTIYPSSNPLWTAPLLAAGSQSWSYQIVAGADFSAANVTVTQSQSRLQTLGLGGSVLLGQGAPSLPTSLSRNQNNRNFVVGTLGFFQTIRTGTGNITIDAGVDVQLLNNLATIYTAGTQAPSLNNFNQPVFGSTVNPPSYGAQYSYLGGNVTISAQGNIAHLTPSGQADSSLEMPTNWLYRQGALGANGQFLAVSGRVASTSWWVDFSNFFEGIGALGGGNVTLTAGRSVNNVDAVIPTNERTTNQTTLPNGTVDKLAADQTQVELGGGDLVVHAGDNINGGVYYVERGQGTLTAGNSIMTNLTRAAVSVGSDAVQQTTTWLPTTLFLGDGSFDVSANNNVLLGPVANPFLLPQGLNNSSTNKSYFSTYATTDSVDVSSIGGTVTLKDSADNGDGSLANWYSKIYLATNGQSFATSSQPWLKSVESGISPFLTVSAVLPATLNATAFSGDVDLLGALTLSPSPDGTINLLAADSVNGFQVNSEQQNGVDTYTQLWGSSYINLSDANPANIPGIISPLSSQTPSTNPAILASVNSLFAESGATENLVLQTKEALHAEINHQPLHANDPSPIHIYAESGDISGLTLFSGKAARVIASQDITDIALYVQNVSTTDVTLVAAGRDIIAYDPESALRLDAAAAGNDYIGATTQTLSGSGPGGPDAGDIQISGPGTLEVLAGRNLNLGIGPENSNGTEVGISSIGNVRNPALAFGGADVIAAAGLGTSEGFDGQNLGFSQFDNLFLNPSSANSSTYLPDLATLLGLTGESDTQVWQAFDLLPSDQKDTFALDIFYLVLRDSGRNHNTGAGTGYASGFDAIHALFPSASAATGDISLTSREVKTTNGGNISLLAPNGQLTVGFDIAGNQPLDQGILTEDGGNISLFTNGNVNVGTSRIFTLHGGNEIIWSSTGDIAAGNSSKTVQSAPPTRVLVDPQSGSVQTDLAGLATGGGIGVLETVVGAPPSDVDLIAPVGTVNAGDAGIRVSGNLNIAAARVLNAGNIQVGGKSSGVPTTATPNISGLSAASSATGAATSAADQSANQGRNQVAQQQEDLPSIITVEVLGYGGSGDD
jgi:filamentous hemagglutinin